MEGSIVDTRDGRRRPFRWQPGTVVFGSGVEADLVLPDSAVAAKHGRIEVADSGCKITVEPGVPPVKVNGAITREAAIDVGDVVRIGPFQISLSGAGTEAPATAPPPAAERPARPVAAARPAAGARPAARPAVASSRAAAPAARPSFSRHAGTRAAVVEEDSPEESRAAQRMRARTAPKADGRSMLIGGGIFLGIVLLAVVFLNSGNAWSQLGDESFPQERLAVQSLIGECKFAEAKQRVDDLMAKTSDSSTKNKLIDVRDMVNKAKARYDDGRKELDRIRNTIGKREKYYIVNDDLPVYISQHSEFKPLVAEAEQLADELRKGKVSSPAPAAGTSEADLAPGQAAPGFDKRNEHAAGKDGNKDAPIKKDGGP
ncbi:MAG TPA: FHA domain-containing protein [Planctomycetota bacterium]|nr:FHA domain-containing protein [Planctomycetota bacterium]